jgi:hypothetical protein
MIGGQTGAKKVKKKEFFVPDSMSGTKNSLFKFPPPDFGAGGKGGGAFSEAFFKKTKLQGF